MSCLSSIALGLWIFFVPAIAQGADGSSQSLNIVLMLAALSLLPLVLVMITSFVKISVVLSILRHALGTPQIPPTIVITGLSVILTVFIMAPTGAKVYQAIKPELQMQQRNKKPDDFFSAGSAKTMLRAAYKAKEPIHKFLSRHSRARDRQLFLNLLRRLRPKVDHRAMTSNDLQVVVPAFVIGQLAEAFQIGFLIFVPFLIIDMVVANILLALGMHMLSPPTISLPFKLLLFVLVDGWILLTQGLLLSYA